MQGLVLLKNNFFIKLSVFELVPRESRTLGPLGDLQGTSPGRRVSAGNGIKTLLANGLSIFSY